MIAGGGILVDHGWHLFYLLLALCGRTPEWIRAAVDRRRYLLSDVEDTARCFIGFGSLTAEIHLTWAGTDRRTSWQLRGTDGTLSVEERWLVLERGGTPFRFAFQKSLSDGSSHPEWFGPVIESFVREIDDPGLRGRNLTEAEQCLILTILAYESAARNGSRLTVSDCAKAEPAPCR